MSTIHILRGTIKLFSPALIGSGNNEETDIDLLLDGEGKPFIPGTSIAGVLRNLSKSALTANELESLWGFTKDEKSRQSLLLFSDLPGENIKTGRRTGVKINNSLGTAEDKALYEYQIIESGDFDLKIEGRSHDGGEAKLIEKAFCLFNSLMKNKISVGAKTNSGFGLIGLKDNEDLKYYKLDLSKKEHLRAWLTDNYESCDLTKFKNNIDAVSHQIKKFALLSINMVLKSSFIIRDYSADPDKPDATSLRSASDFVISGTSLKGALRSRAEKIINTIGGEEKTTEILVNSLFGYIAKNNTSSDRGKKGKITVEEVKFSSEYVAEQQTRIKIDRFTGGTIAGALLEEMPVFSTGRGDNNQVLLNIKIKDYEDWEVGLLLLLLKDLWTGDLPVGGEKAIGRGVFEGKSASVILKDNDKKVFKFEKSNNGIELSCQINDQKSDNQNVIENLNSYIDKLRSKIEETKKNNEVNNGRNKQHA